MIRSRSLFVALPSAALLASTSLFASPRVAADDPETVTVEQGPFRVELSLDGAFDAKDAVEISCRPEQFRGALLVAEATASGEVEEGQVLVRFDTEELDQQIERGELELELARAAFAKKQQEAAHGEEGIALKLRSAEMAYETAKQSFETFRDVLLPMQREEAELGLQSSRDRMKDEEAQFEQLLAMYKSDDLVEETEEIVLARSRRSLEQQRKRQSFNERRHELQMEVDLPRDLENREMAMRRAANAWELAQVSAEWDRAETGAELRKAELALARQAEDLEELKGDRHRLILRADRGGLAIAGQLSKGKWTRLDHHPDGARPRTRVQPEQVLYTVVQPGPTTVRTTVSEASLLDLEVGMTATVRATARDNSEIAATVARVAPVSMNGQYDVWLDIGRPDPELLPGHSCKVSVTVLDVEQALTVPEAAVDRERSSVWVWTGEAVAREVELGRSSKGRVQILSGLAAGEEVLAKAPEE